MAGEIILSDKSLEYAGKADVDVIGTFKGFARVEVSGVKGAEFGAAARQDAVDHHLD